MNDDITSIPATNVFDIFKQHFGDTSASGSQQQRAKNIAKKKNPIKTHTIKKIEVQKPSSIVSITPNCLLNKIPSKNICIIGIKKKKKVFL